jgi:hypothetical protein
MSKFIQLKFDEKANNINVNCCSCNKSVRLHDIWIDELMKNFNNYYCNNCKDDIIKTLSKKFHLKGYS